MATDAPDWQRVVVLETSVTGDSPDWQNVVVGPGGEPVGGGYVSLTGPGQTATPGDLTQEGGFTVNVSSSAGVNVNATGPLAAVQVSSEAGILIFDTSSSGVQIEEFGSGQFSISGFGIMSVGITTSISLRAPLIGLLTNPGDLLGFYNVSGVGAPQQTVTGSRGGNAALASLLTALAAYGLIIDSSTP